MKKMVALLMIGMLLGSTGLWAQDDSVPSKELYQRTRDALKVSLENGELDRAGESLDYLKGNVKNGAPLSYFEEYLADMELQHFEEGIRLYSDIRRDLLDSNYRKTDDRKTVSDSLKRYLIRNHNPLKKNVADSLYARVDASDVNQEYKDLYKTLLYSELVVGVTVVNGSKSTYFISDTTYAEEFLAYAKSFVEKYPSSEHCAYLKNNAIPLVQKNVDERKLFSNDPIAHKYYTGGFDFYVGTWVGLVGGSINNIAETGFQTPFQLELQIRYWRISLGLFVDHAFTFEPNGSEEVYYEEDDTSTAEPFGVTLGFTAYDSHYLRVEPFVGFGTSLIADGGVEYDASFCVLGANADFRFYSARPKRIGSNSLAFMLRLKYKAMLGTAESNVENGGHKNPSYGIAYHLFGLSLGVNFW